MKNLDKQHIEYILRYCAEVAETIDRFGNSFDTFVSATKDVERLKEALQNYLRAQKLRS